MSIPVVRSVEEAPCLSVLGDVYRVVLSGDDTGGALCVIDQLLAPGGGPPLHRHSREDEAFVVLEGAVQFVVDGKELTAGAGAYVYAPRGSVHRFTNAGKGTARMIITITPAGLERMFAEIGTRLPAGSTTPTAVDEATIARVVEACPRYGIELLPG
jgi:quercetin dioxygenase-like cupin family protein